jgi:hypothetical protein
MMGRGARPGPARRRFAWRAAVAVAATGCSLLAAGVGTAVAATHAAAGGRAATVAGAWGTAKEVPGLAALNKGGNAKLTSVSCASPGDCSAGGTYTDGSGHTQAFVVNEENGTWRQAKEVPGLAALNVGGTAGFSSVSCASAGNCSAGGSYTDASGKTQAFVVGEKNDTWGRSTGVLGSAALGNGIRSVSCASAGNCSAVGGGAFPAPISPFIVDETDGTWRKAEKVPGLATLNVDRVASFYSVSCAVPGNCSADGYYKDGSGIFQAFVVSEGNGTWRKAEQVPGTARLNQTGATGEVMSCTSAGTCGAGGSYGAGCGCSEYGDSLPFVVSEKNGDWGNAAEVPGSFLNNADYADLTSLSCASAGNCGAGGYYDDGSQQFCCLQALVATEKNGTWGTAEEVPGTAALDVGGDASITSVSCASAGNCSAGGYYADSSSSPQAFVVSETKGIWRKAKMVPGLMTLNAGGNASISSVSCGSTSNCGAGGSYTDSSGRTQAFVVTETAAAGP